MNQHINKLLNKLSFLGYGSFAIKSIIEEIVKTDNLELINATTQLKLIKQLEVYAQLGLDYQQAYSK